MRQGSAAGKLCCTKSVSGVAQQEAKKRKRRCGRGDAMRKSSKEAKISHEERKMGKTIYIIGAGEAEILQRRTTTLRKYCTWTNREARASGEQKETAR